MDKIDMVYLWCDGSEIEFQKRRQQYLPQTENIEVSGIKRFFNNDELKYSLRSLEKNASWINHVFIVTDRQVPEWLNTKYEKVTVIDHSEIIPKEIIPCFNSDVLEYFLPFIPDLAEKFLYGNDDTFFGRKVVPEDFFTDDKPIVRVKKAKLSSYRNKKTDYSFIGTVYNSLFLLGKKYSSDIMPFILHHNIDAYTKRAFLETYYRFEDELKKCMNNRFRNITDIERHLFSFDMIYNKKATLRLVEDPKPWRRKLNFIFPVNWESYMDEDGDCTRMEILKYKPMLFCLNGNNDFTIQEKIKSKQFMESLFPLPSKFEII